MKYYFAGACVIVAAAAAMFYSAKPKLSEHAQWRMTAVEKETKVRPARFEQMKFQGNPEVRAPASKKDK